MDPTIAVIVSIPVLCFLLLIGVPIFVSLGIIGITGVTVLNGADTGFGLMREGPFPAILTYEFVVLPLFVFMGHLAFQAGVTSNAYDIGRKWLSKLPGGLALATTMACAALGAACGSSVAASATMGKIAIPEMEESGYDPKLACGSVAAGGLLAIMIPPSVILVLYAVFTDNSVGACMMAGLLPGIVTTMVFMAGISILTLKNPNIAPPTRSYPWKDKIVSLTGGWKFVFLFLIVIGGIYGGIFTPSEAAAGGAFAAFIMLLATRKNVGFKIKESLVESIQTTVFILIIIVCAGFYSYFLLIAGVPSAITAWIGTLKLPPVLILVGCLLIYLPLGCLLDPTSCLLITLPLTYPIIVNELGYSPIWYGVLVTKMIEIGLLTPPVGLNVYTVAAVAPHVPLEDVFKGIGWFIVFEAFSLLILLIFPSLATWLPAMMTAR